MSTTNPLFQGEGIKELIPQRYPIIMVDTFYDATEMECNTGLTILDDNIFCENASLFLYFYLTVLRNLLLLMRDIKRN